mmetsp:Transcript_15765/g.22422  ORF Transcript_15765/g.22422 Transcript_15765/m.22422 type:complete len:209 (-) Transcript_15765:50-676(-)
MFESCDDLIKVGTSDIAAASSFNTLSSSNSSILVYSSSSPISSTTSFNFLFELADRFSSVLRECEPLSKVSPCSSIMSNCSSNSISLRCCCSSADIKCDISQSSTPHFSSICAVSSPDVTTEFSNTLTLAGHGTFLVTRYCLSSGKKVFFFFGSPDSQHHVGHLYTNSSPARTNSSGVNTPLFKKADSFNVGVAHSLAFLNLFAPEVK